jgi:hypothetical protein
MCVLALAGTILVSSLQLAAVESSRSRGRSAASRSIPELQLLGDTTVSYNDATYTTVRITFQEVRNNRQSGVSGDIKLALWLFANSPYQGEGGRNGWKLGEISVGTVAAGASVRYVDQTVNGLGYPPDGTYYSTVILTETTGTSTLMYDYRDFSGTVVYTNAAAKVVDPPKLYGSSTASARQGAPFSLSFDASGGLPITITASGMPSGLQLKNNVMNIDNWMLNPTISGIPTSFGTFTVQVTATNDSGKGSATITMTVDPKTDNAPPTITSTSATPNPAQTGQQVAFFAAATDPENVVPTFTWDFKDGSTGSGASVYHTFSAAGTYAVQVSASDGVNTVTNTVSVTVSTSSSSNPVVTSISASSNPAQINTAVTFTAVASGTQPLAYSWNFGDGSTPAKGNPVTHTYVTKGEYTVTVSVSDAANHLGVSDPYTLFVADPSASQNLETGKTVNSPEGLQVTVLPAPTGVVALGLNVVTPRGVADRSAYNFYTDFYLPGRAAQTFADGDRPNSRFRRSGVLVTTSTATGKTDNTKLRGRKSIPLSDADVGNEPTVPDTLTAAQKGIRTVKLSGSFNFASDKTDLVTVTLSVQLPAGYDLLRSQELSLGTGNVTDRIVLNAKGKSTGLSDRGVMQKVSIKYPRSSNGVTLAGQSALITATFSAPNLDDAGFESDGVSLAASGANMITYPRLQVAAVLAGIAYSGEISTVLKVDSKGDKAKLTLAK